MADYTQWDINDYLPGQPFTSAKAISYHENLNAYSEGADGAPINQGAWHPYDATEYGESGGLLYSHAVDGDIAAIETPVFVTGFEYRIVCENVRCNTTSATTKFQLRESTYREAIDFGDTSGSNRLSAELRVLRPWGVKNVNFWQGIAYRGAHSSIVSTDLLVSGALVRDDGGASAIDRMRIAPSGGVINLGKAWLFRRKVEGF